ncbi:MAG: hypothetical protein NTX76_04185 [Alphaproteobacteria bacterium]|nr:hypothetical protein [Alphaproteobacteria bacterium]
MIFRFLVLVCFSVLSLGSVSGIYASSSDHEASSIIESSFAGSRQENIDEIFLGHPCNVCFPDSLRRIPELRNEAIECLVRLCSNQLDKLFRGDLSSKIDIDMLMRERLMAALEEGAFSHNDPFSFTAYSVLRDYMQIGSKTTVLGFLERSNAKHRNTVSMAYSWKTNPLGIEAYKKPWGELCAEDQGKILLYADCGSMLFQSICMRSLILGCDPSGFEKELWQCMNNQWQTAFDFFVDYYAHRLKSSQTQQGQDHLRGRILNHIHESPRAQEWIAKELIKDVPNQFLLGIFKDQYNLDSNLGPIESMMAVSSSCMYPAFWGCLSELVSLKKGLWAEKTDGSRLITLEAWQNYCLVVRKNKACAGVIGDALAAAVSSSDPIMSMGFSAKMPIERAAYLEKLTDTSKLANEIMVQAMIGNYLGYPYQTIRDYFGIGSETSVEQAQKIQLKGDSIFDKILSCTSCSTTEAENSDDQVQFVEQSNRDIRNRLLSSCFTLGIQTASPLARKFWMGDPNAEQESQQKGMLVTLVDQLEQEEAKNRTENRSMAKVFPETQDQHQEAKRQLRELFTVAFDIAEIFTIENASLPRECMDPATLLAR